MNLTELLDRTASSWPNKMALIDADAGVSYADLANQSRMLAAQLKAAHFSEGCRIGLCLPNSCNYIALTFALWRIGAVVVPIPTESTESERANIATMMQLEAILSRKPRAQSKGSERLAPDVFISQLNPEPPPDNHGLNLAFIRFTSGTTAQSKGVALCHETIHERVIAANQALQISPADTVMWCLPMSHHFLVTIVLYISQGATIVLARHILSRQFLDSVNRWQGTVLYAAPFHYSLLARDGSELNLGSVRLAVSTTCGLTEAVADCFRERFGLPLSQALGVIELGLVCVNVDEPVSRWNSVGRPMSKFAVNVKNPDSNGYGEIEVSGPGFFDAYTHPWTPRERLMPDGWFSTGDFGRVDAEGYLYLAGRKSAVINLAGRKVFPEEIEFVLNRHPSVKESRAYGILHPHLGEVVEAEVVLKDSGTPDALRDFCRLHLSADKVPSFFHPVAFINKTATTHKIMRHLSPPVA